MKVVIEARLPDPGASGGVSQAIISLATALSSLGDCRPDEEFVFVTLESAGPWLDRHVAGPCRLHKQPLTWKNRVSRSPIGPASRAALRAMRQLRRPSPAGIVTTDGTAERLGASLVHFPTQEGYLTDLPTIYQPHDLQHLHLPQFFPAKHIAWRDLAYPVYCSRADLVLVESTWTKQDIERHYNIAANNIAVCPFPPATSAYRKLKQSEEAALRRKLRRQQFIYYPAHTWPHKNHLCLMEALAELKSRGIVVPLVCTGHATSFFPEIEAAMERLQITDQVQFLGYVSEAEITALYALCIAVVVPTLFESVSFPVWEAFAAAKPVASSNVTSLPMQVGDAGLLFDPNDATAIAVAIRALWGNPELRARLGDAGSARLQQFSLDRMGLHIRALYRSLAGEMDARDRSVLDAAPLI